MPVPLAGGCKKDKKVSRDLHTSKGESAYSFVSTSHDKNNEATMASFATNAPVLKRNGAKTSLKALAASAVQGSQGGAPAADRLPLGELKTVPLADVRVEDRARRDLGDIKGLARSIAETGLAQPPLVDAQMRLVCGHRRVEAARYLNWEKIPVRVLDIEDPLALMVAEDANRKDLTASEKYAVCETLRGRAKEEGWRKRSFGGRLEKASEKGRLDEEIARAVRLSRETLRKIRAIHAAAEDDPAKFAILVERLDADGRVDRHYRDLERLRGRGDASLAAALVVRPGWIALYEEAEARDVAKFVKDSFLVAGGGEGTVLLFPTSVESLREAVGLVRQGGFEWRATLCGSGAQGEDLWVVGALGKKTEILAEAAELIAEGCAKGLDAALQSADVAFDGEARSLNLNASTNS